MPLPRPSLSGSAVKMISLDLDGTLLGADGQVSERNRAALLLAGQAGVEVVIATGRRHFYAMRVLSDADLPAETLLVSSNGAVVRTLAHELVERTHMQPEAIALLCAPRMAEYRNALVVTFDKVGADGEDTRGALVFEELADLHNSIGRWMTANEPYILHVNPIENALLGEPAPIQMMLCGTVERMRRAEAALLEDEGVAAVGEMRAGGLIALNRTEYPDRDLSIVDILPAGCSKGAALLRLAAARGIRAEEMMAIGDNWNDLSMLEIAGHPVLMANAPADLREHAARRGWQVCGANDADGVAGAIEAALTVAAAAESHGGLF